MESSGKDETYADSSQPPSEAHEEYAVPDVIITRRLRDREQLRKRKVEAQEKDAIQWDMSRVQEKRRRRGRRGRRGRGRQRVVEINLEPEPNPGLDEEPKPQEDVKPTVSGSAAPSEPAYPDELPMLTYQDVVSGIQSGVMEGEVGASSQDPAGEGDLLSPAEEIPEDWNTSLETDDEEDNEYTTHLLF